MEALEVPGKVYLCSYIRVADTSFITSEIFSLVAEVAMCLEGAARQARSGAV